MTNPAALSIALQSNVFSRFSGRLFLIVVFTLVAARVGYGQDSPWISLFDGQSLAGWSSPVDGDVKAENGEITIASTKNLWLVHHRTFRDFELTVEARMPADSYNSGIGFRCQPGNKLAGYQCEIDRAKSGMIYAIGSGWVWPQEADARKAFETESRNHFDNAEWNSFRVRCQGDHIQVWINDREIADIHDARFSEGNIALQHHGKGGVHRFRKLRIRELATYRVTSPPAALQLPPFYTKYVSASGYPVVGSSKVNDYALKEAAYLIDMMLAQRADLREAMIASGSRMIVIAHDEFTTDIPEYAKLRPKDYWDARARGLGGSREEPVCSCAEENVLAFRGDPYAAENILIHEFAHNIHLRGMVNLDATFDDRLKQTYERAMSAGLWKSKYASTNHAEYFAEGVQSWFNNNRPPDHDHNHVDTRQELREYDPGLAAICEEVFGQTTLVYTKPTTRLTGHLKGYDPSQSPTFQWPQRLEDAKKKIREEVQRRGDDRQQEYKN